MSRQWRSDDTSPWIFKYGTGKDGSPTFTTSTLSRASAGCAATKGGLTTTLDDISTFANGDLVWMHQSRGGNTARRAIVSITRSVNTATVTTSGNHGYLDGISVTISGANQADYNGHFQITVTGVTTFTYQVANTPTTPSTGTRFVTKDNWELNKIVSGAGTLTLTLALPIQDTYTDSGADQAQIGEIKEYASPTLPAGVTLSIPAWDGNKDGLGAFFCTKPFIPAGTITTVGKGFRGGTGSKTTDSPGRQGEGVAGDRDTISTSANSNGGGGGGGGTTDNARSGGGGGGANAAVGTTGQNAFTAPGGIGGEIVGIL